MLCRIGKLCRRIGKTNFLRCYSDSEMAPGDKKPSAERDQTDQGLRAERENTDRALKEKEAADKDADRVVERARENADAILVAARGKADERREEAAPPVRTAATAAADQTLDEERKREDEILEKERAFADERLKEERVKEAEALSRLLPLEREKTDRYLLTERARSDDAVSHRDDFLGIVSHDVRNLLGGIVMSATLLSERAAANEEGNKTLVETARIQRYAARMNRLIGDLVDVASIDAGQLAVTPVRGDFASLIAEAVDTFEATASAKGISLTAEVAEPLPADFDHDRMLQVLANLVTNALKFTPKTGAIRVRGERAGHELRISVRDNGTGIAENLLDAVFERFGQVTKGDRRGVGLGLYISRCMVEAHGGKIWAESKLGGGSALSFTFPVDAAHQRAG